MILCGLASVLAAVMLLPAIELVRSRLFRFVFAPLGVAGANLGERSASEPH